MTVQIMGAPSREAGGGGGGGGSCAFLVILYTLSVLNMGGGAPLSPEGLGGRGGGGGGGGVGT